MLDTVWIFQNAFGKAHCQFAQIANSSKSVKFVVKLEIFLVSVQKLRNGHTGEPVKNYHCLFHANRDQFLLCGFGSEPVCVGPILFNELNLKTVFNAGLYCDNLRSDGVAFKIDFSSLGLALAFLPIINVELVHTSFIFQNVTPAHRDRRGVISIGLVDCGTS